MTTHHAQGIELANLAVSRASDPHLRSLAMLMVASQTGEVRIFERWWQSWFDAPIPRLLLCIPVIILALCIGVLALQAHTCIFV
jgi:hypothetical protein